MRIRLVRITYVAWLVGEEKAGRGTKLCEVKYECKYVKRKIEKPRIGSKIIVAEESKALIRMEGPKKKKKNQDGEWIPI